MAKLGNISIVRTIPLQKLTGTINSTTQHAGLAIDTKVSEGFSFDSALFLIEVGSFVNSPTNVTVKIQESDVADFSSGVTDASGGEAINIVANSSYKMEVERKKRYLRAVVQMTSGVTAGEITIYVGAILNNWQKPFSIL